MAELSAEPLQWEAEENGCGLDARSGSGRYTVWREEREWRASFRDGGYLYRGPSLSDGMAAAQGHHEAAARRLAWERYMAENDPPSAQVDVSRAITEAIKDGPDLDAPVAKMYSTEEAMRILANDPPSNGEAL